MRTVLLAWSPLYVPHVGAGLPSRLSLRRTHPRGGGIGRHFSLTMCGASLRHETSAAATLLTPYRTAVEYGGWCRRRAGQVSVARQGQGTGSDWGDGTTGDRKMCDELVWAAMNEKEDRAVAVGGVAGEGERCSRW